MARKIGGGKAGVPSVSGILVDENTVMTAAEDADIVIMPQGTGTVQVDGTLEVLSENTLNFYDLDTTNFIALKAPSAVSSDYTMTWPASVAASNGYVLTSTTNGTLSWSAPGTSVTDTSSDTATNYITFTDATTGLVTENRISSSKLTFQPSTGTFEVVGTVLDLLTENSKTASHTLALADRNKVVYMTNSTSATITIPNDSTVNFPVGSVIYISRAGSGTVTIAAAGGVTASATGDMAVNEELYIRKRGANNWKVLNVPYNYTASVSGGSASTSGGFTRNTFTSSGTLSLSVS